MASVRHERVQEQIKQVASKIILFELKDPRLGFVTVTRVDLSPDLRFAKIFYSVLGSDAEIKLTERAIRHAGGHIQREIAKNVRLRFAPEVSFEYDDSPRKSIELGRLIDEVVAEDQRKKKNEDEEEETADEEETPEEE